VTLVLPPSHPPSRSKNQQYPTLPTAGDDVTLFPHLWPFTQAPHICGLCENSVTVTKGKKKPMIPVTWNFTQAKPQSSQRHTSVTQIPKSRMPKSPNCPKSLAIPRPTYVQTPSTKRVVVGPALWLHTSSCEIHSIPRRGRTRHPPPQVYAGRWHTGCSTLRSWPPKGAGTAVAVGKSALDSE